MLQSPELRPQLFSGHTLMGSSGLQVLRAMHVLMTTR